MQKKKNSVHLYKTKFHKSALNKNDGILSLHFVVMKTLTTYMSHGLKLIGILILQKLKITCIYT